MAKSRRADDVPDTARVYERARPEAEAGMGRLDNNDDATPTKSGDSPEKTVSNRQENRQLNGEDLPRVEKRGVAKRDKRAEKSKQPKG